MRHLQRRKCQRLRTLKSIRKGKTTSGPIHGQIDGPEKLFKLAEVFFLPRTRFSGNQISWKIGPWAGKWLSASLSSFSGRSIWPWIGPEVVFPYRIDSKVRCGAVRCGEVRQSHEANTRSPRTRGKCLEGDVARLNPVNWYTPRGIPGESPRESSGDLKGDPQANTEATPRASLLGSSWVSPK